MEIELFSSFILRWFKNMKMALRAKFRNRIILPPIQLTLSIATEALLALRTFIFKFWLHSIQTTKLTLEMVVGSIPRRPSWLGNRFDLTYSTVGSFRCPWELDAWLGTSFNFFIFRAFGSSCWDFELLYNSFSSLTRHVIFSDTTSIRKKSIGKPSIRQPSVSQLSFGIVCQLVNL